MIFDPIARPATLAAAATLLFAVVACNGGNPSLSPARTVTAITREDVKARVYAVADDSMKGRAVGTIGNFMMTTYVAHEMARLGLEPGGENGTWFQVVPMVQRSVDSASALSVNGQKLSVFTDFVPVRPTSTLRYSAVLATGTFETVYGGRAGDSTVSLSPADVNGRVIVFDAPLGANGQPSGVTNTAGATAVSKYPGAAAVMIAALDLVTGNAASALRRSGVGLSGPGMTPGHTPFGMLITSAAAEKIMGAPIVTLRPGAKGAAVTANVRFTELPVAAPARNVVAIVRGTDPALRGEYVAIGAHSDHLAPAARPVDHDSLRAYNTVMRPAGGDTRVASTTPATPAQLQRVRQILDSLRKLRPPRPDSIYNGADDDGSGSVALLEIAESLAGGKRPRRSILLVWHTGEEAGLLGSAWFTAHPTVPHDSITAQLNMDMVGRGTAKDTPLGGPRNLQVIGSRRLSTDLGDVLDSVNAASATPYLIDYAFDAPHQVQNRYCRSDHYMYARTGIPIAYMSRGYHQDYHMVTDEPQYINYDGLAHVAGFVRDVALAVANRNDRVRVDKPLPDPLAPCQQ